MTLDDPVLAASTGAPPAQPAAEPAFRSHANPDGFLHVVKGRSYIEPVCGRSPPLSLQQGINGLVGKKKVCKGDIEGLKKNLGLVMASTDGVISSRRFVLTSKVLGWTRENTLVPDSWQAWGQEGDIEGSSVASSRHTAPVFLPDTASNPRLYPDRSYLMNRRKQGQCYSLMMQAQCQERLFYAELTRARRIASKTTFIRTRHESRLAERSREFQGYEAKDAALLKAVKAYMLGVRRQSLVAMALRNRSVYNIKSIANKLSDVESLDVDEAATRLPLVQSDCHWFNQAATGTINIETSQ